MEETILNYIHTKELIEDTLQFASEQNKDHQELVGTLKSLESENYVVLTQLEKKGWNLTQEGQNYVENGTPEYRIFQLIKQGGQVTKDSLTTELGAQANIGIQNGMKKKWFQFDGSQLKTQVESVVDEDKQQLDQIVKGNQDLPKKDLDTLKKRQLIQQFSLKYYKVVKGSSFSLQRVKKATDLTADMIAKGTWKDAQFKPYNYHALGKEIQTGNLHPLLKVRSQFRTVLIEMGFSEMPTNNFVESSFWNFDTLFQPQQHPARDAHDTFFLSDPAQCKVVDQEYWNRVKEMHEKGGHGSIGWKYNWSEEEAKKNILRTHTTATSSKMLYRLAKETQEHGFKPKKWFSIDRVFRNENLDATHLAEFHQVEGLVVDRKLGLAHLKGIIAEFFRKIGIKQLRFKPAYNPYTEPSMEIFGFHPLLNRWVEIGNSGVFRPEMLKPMGLPDDVSVVAWGLSLERPTMIQYGVANIRELIGSKVNIKYVKENPIVCYQSK